MHKLATLTAAGAALAACASAPDDRKTCAELAQVRAAGQIERETALLEQHEAGRPGKSEVQRKLIAMDAEAYRVAVYEGCLRRRGLTTRKTVDERHWPPGPWHGISAANLVV